MHEDILCEKFVLANLGDWMEELIDLNVRVFAEHFIGTSLEYCGVQPTGK